MRAYRQEENEMKERIESILNALKAEKKETEQIIRNLEWGIKYAPSMTINGKEQLAEQCRILHRIKEQIEKLEWIKDGE